MAHNQLFVEELLNISENTSQLGQLGRPFARR